jgi:hypothetical protein
MNQWLNCFRAFCPFSSTSKNPIDDPYSTSKILVSPGEPSTSHKIDKTKHWEHPPHPNCPDTLDCLPATDGRPQHTLPVILRCAILGSPRKRLTIREIYSAMESKYPYYRTAGPTWKVSCCVSNRSRSDDTLLLFMHPTYLQQSVRHHLSLNRLFERQARPATDPGFGSYWTVNLEAPPGTKRPRKRGRNKTNANAIQPVIEEVESKSNIIPPTSPYFSRSPVPESSSRSTLDTVASRPAFSFSSVLSREAHAIEDEFENQSGLEEEEDYESEDEMTSFVFHGQAPFGGSSLYDAPVYHAQSFSRAVFPKEEDEPTTKPKGKSTETGRMIEELKLEVADLRRQASDAALMKRRILDQLAEAQADATRSRAVIKTMEKLLEDEGKKRQEAERLAHDEARLRRNAEEALQRMHRLEAGDTGEGS